MPDKRPAVLLIHGGGFTEGHEIHAGAPGAVRSHGMKPIEVHYTLGDIGAAMNDVKRIAKREAKEGRAVVAYGESAGGTLAARLAQKGLVERAVAFVPATDLVHLQRLNSTVADMIRSAGTEGERHNASPAFYGPSESPILVQRTDTDPFIPPEQTQAWIDSDPKVRGTTVDSVHGNISDPAERKRQLDQAMNFLVKATNKASGEMAHKTFELIETKADDKGSFTALASVFGNVDRGGDRMVKGAFRKTLEKLRLSGKSLPIILSHQWDSLTAYVGEAEPRGVYEDEKGLVVQGKLYMDEPEGRKVHKLMKAGLLTGWSFGYTVPEGGQRKAKDGANEITEVELFEAGPTLVGMNPDAQLQAVKSEDPDEDYAMDTAAFFEAKAVWSTAFINDLPDSSFLYIEPGGEKDDQGKTTPRSLRHFPVKNADGTPDPAHVRNALARIPQSNLDQAIKDRCTNAARRLLNAMSSAEPDEKAEEIEALHDKVDELTKQLEEQAEVARKRIEELEEERRNEEPERAKSPPDPLREESRKAVYAALTDDLPAAVKTRKPEPKPEPEPEIDIRELKERSRLAVLSALKGDSDGNEA